MGLFGRRRGSNVEYGWIRGDGWALLRHRIDTAINEDGFLFVIIAGERGKGKSTLALNIAMHVYNNPELVEKSLAFTLDDYEYIVDKAGELRARDGRTKLIVWDDIGVHFSTYKWFSPHQRQKMIDFLENFQSVREEVAVLIGTVVEIEMLPPKLRTAANMIVDCQRRGQGKLFRYTRYLWLRKWKAVGTIEWGKTEESLYKRYRELKRLAHRARRKAKLVTFSKLAKIYAEVVKTLAEQGEVDLELLYGLGIVNKDGELTEFGYLVLKKAGLVLEDLLPEQGVVA